MRAYQIKQTNKKVNKCRFRIVVTSARVEKVIGLGTDYQGASKELVTFNLKLVDRCFLFSFALHAHIIFYFSIYKAFL